MANLKLTFVSQDYEHTRALFDGRVPVEGIDLAHMELFPSITFHRMVGSKEFEFTEMAMTLYVSTLDLEDRPFIALPVFPVRCFRHSAIYVSAKSGIRDPKDLAGRKIGEFFFYGHDAGLWAKGALQSEYGVAYDSYSQYISAASGTRRRRCRGFPRARPAMFAASISAPHARSTRCSMPARSTC